LPSSEERASNAAALCFEALKTARLPECRPRSLGTPQSDAMPRPQAHVAEMSYAASKRALKSCA